MQALEMLETLGLPEDLIADVRSMLNERAEILEAWQCGRTLADLSRGW